MEIFNSDPIYDDYEAKSQKNNEEYIDQQFLETNQSIFDILELEIKQFKSSL